MIIWISHLEISLNNYLYSGIWFQQFQEVIILQISITTQRLVAYFLIRKVIDETFKEDLKNELIQEQADPTLISKGIINLNHAEASKFSYIIGWVLFKLLKQDDLMNSHSKFSLICILLKNLYTEKVEYMLETKS